MVWFLILSHLLCQSAGVDDENPVLTAAPQLPRHWDHLSDGAARGTQAQRLRTLRIPETPCETERKKLQIFTAKYNQVQKKTKSECITGLIFLSFSTESLNKFIFNVVQIKERSNLTTDVFGIAVSTLSASEHIVWSNKLISVE